MVFVFLWADTKKVYSLDLESETSLLIKIEKLEKANHTAYQGHYYRNN